MNMKTILGFLLASLVVAAGSAPAQAAAGAAGAAGTAAPVTATVLGGDFQVGDQIDLQVEGDSSLSRTFTVGPGPALPLPVIGAIPLAGVRRSEVEAYLTRQLSRYLKAPVVHAKALVHLSIIGEVEHPGFYSVPVDMVLGEAVMRAGGPTRDAKVAAMRIERDGRSILRGDSLQLALGHALTVAQVGLHDGDRLIVPRLIVHDSESTVRIIAILVTIPAAIFGITHLFSH
jgi:polysaccharide biosynthesis/export protein